MLEQREVTRVCGVSPIALDVRVIAVSNRSPHGAILQGALRSDLYIRRTFVANKRNLTRTAEMLEVARGTVYRALTGSELDAANGKIRGPARRGRTLMEADPLR